MFDATSFLDEEGFENPRSRLLNPYYAIKPLMPREAQLVLRRVYARRQLRRRFPAWPIEALLVDRLRERFRAELQGTGAGRVPFINFWPERKRFAFVLTHDVEDTVGAENIPRMLEIERRHGVRSSWNFVADDYPIDPGLFAAIREAGCEIGLHGLHHDGALFASRAHFDAAVPHLNRYLREWDAVGFRAPYTHRNPAWLQALDIVGDHALQPGHTLTAGELDDSEPILLCKRGRASCGRVVFMKHLSGGLRNGLHKFASGFGNSDVALLDDFARVDLPVIDLLIRVFVGAQDGTFQRHAGECAS